MSLKSVEIRNYRCFVDETPLVIPLDAAVIAFVGPNNAGKTAALKAFYELKILWQICIPPSLITFYGRNQGIGAFTGVKDQAEVYPHGGERPLSVDWKFTRSDDESTADTAIQRIRVWLDPPTQVVRVQITLQSGEVVPENVTLSWSPEAEAFSWPGPRAAAAARGLALAAQRFGQARFVPAIRSAATSAQGTLYDAPQGIALASEWSGLKAGYTKGGNASADLVESTLERLFGFERLQVNVTPGGGEFSIKIGRRTYRLDEIGNGFAQMLYLAIDTIFRPTSLLLIDEPETGLHPALQRDLLTFLAERSSGNLYFATHSVGLARSVADRVIAIHRHKGKLVVSPMHALENYAEWLGELSFSTWSELGFEALLLVEGPTELRAMPHLLRILGLDSKVMLQSLGGSDLINGSSAAALGEYKRLNCRVFALIDSERTEEGAELAEGRQRFVNACTALGYHVHALQRRAFDNYLTDTSVKLAVRTECRALRPFEKLVGEAPGWSKSQVPTIVQQMKWDDIELTDLGEFLGEMRDRVLRPAEAAVSRADKG